MHAVIPFPDISPDLFSFEIFGFTVALRWYALAYLAGIVVGWQVVLRLMKRSSLWPGNRAPMTPEQVEGLLTWVILGVILGGRLGYVLFYKPAEFAADPASILRIWEGGMSFHGGFLGVCFAVTGFYVRHRIGFLSTVDAMALVTPQALFFGRLANFINAELWGRPSTLPWAVIFPGDAAQHCPGLVGPCARHPSQLYEAGLEGLILGLLLLVVALGGGLKRRGLILGLFIAGYGLSRFVVEFFRQADAQFITDGNPLGHVVQIGAWGLSMGQLLSLPMIALGIGFVMFARRAKLV